MTSLNGFNAAEVDPATEFEPVPAGDYTAVITESETKPTKAGTGTYLQLTFQIVDGEHKGRLLWARLNLDNPSGTAVRIARAELSSICRAVNVLRPRDSLELHNIPLVIGVGLKRRGDTGELANVIKRYMGRPGVSSGVASRAPAAGGTPPWKR